MSTSRFIFIFLILSLNAMAQVTRPAPVPPAPLTDADRMQDLELTEEERKIPLPGPGDERLRLTTKMSTLSIGSIVDMILITTNMSDHAIREERILGSNCGHVDWEGVQIKDPNGNVLKVKERHITVPPGSHEEIVPFCGGSSFAVSKILRPNRSMWGGWSIDLNEYELSLLGTYTIQVYEGQDIEHARMKSNVITITVVSK